MWPNGSLLWVPWYKLFRKIERKTLKDRTRQMTLRLGSLLEVIVEKNLESRQ